MFCTNCGAKNEDTSLFCESCGAKLEVPAVPVTPVAETPVAETPVEEAPVAETPVEEALVAEVAEETVAEPVAPAEPVATYAQPAQPAQPQQGTYTQAVQPVQPVQPAQPVQPQQAAYAQYAQPRQPINMKQLIWPILAGCEAILLIVMIVVFFSVGNGVYSAKNTAVTYYKAYLAQDWDAVYDYIDMDEDEFLTKESFIASQETSAKKDTYTVTAKENPYSKYDTSLDKNEAEVDVTFKSKYHGEQQERLKLTKSGKKFLFFPSWKVSASTYVVNDVTISTYKTFDVYLDGKKLDSTYAKEQDENMVVYTIPHLFRGNHKVAIGFGDAVEDAQIADFSYDGSTYYDYEFSLSGDMLEAASKVGYDSFVTFVNAMVTGADFESVSSLFADAAKQDAESAWSNVCGNYSRFYAQRIKTTQAADIPQTEGITALDLKNMKMTVNGSGVNGDGNLYVDFYLSYDYTSVYRDVTTDWWTGKVTVESKNYDSNGNTEYMRMVYVDGEWKCNANISPYFYYW